MAALFDSDVLDVGTRKWSNRVGHGALGFNSNSQFDGLSMGPTENFLLPAVANVCIYYRFYIHKIMYAILS